MILAGFSTEQDLMRAASRLRAEHIANIETYTPVEPEAQEDKPGGSRIPLLVLIAGVLGAIFMFVLQTYATVVGYPLDIGGRPNFSWPAYVPNAFEFGVLAAIVTGFASFLAINRMPTLYQPIDQSDSFRNASRDGFFLAIDSPDVERVRGILAALHPVTVEEVPE